MSFHHAELRV